MTLTLRHGLLCQCLHLLGPLYFGISDQPNHRARRFHRRPSEHREAQAGFRPVVHLGGIWRRLAITTQLCMEKQWINFIHIYIVIDIYISLYIIDSWHIDIHLVGTCKYIYIYIYIHNMYITVHIYIYII